MKPDIILELRKKHKLHPITEARLRDILAKVKLDAYALPEGWGIAGAGRTDLSIYLHERRVIHIELFASLGTVRRDVTNLLMSRADVKVAIIIDQDADPKVAEAYFRVVADNRFHWDWLSKFLDPENEAEATKIFEALLNEAIQIGGPFVGASASVSPNIGAPFSRATFQVKGFHPDCDFTVYWDPDGLTTVVGAGREIGAKGTADCQILIPHGGVALPGRHTLRAVDALGNVAVAEFIVSSAWPPPYMRAIPSQTRPGGHVTVVGAGAPPNCKLYVDFWQGNYGGGATTTNSNERGEFQAVIEVPWLINITLVSPGRHRVSVRPADGGVAFEAHCYVDLLEFATPGTVEWAASQEMEDERIALLKPYFKIDNDKITISLRIRNDRSAEIYFAPTAAAIILEFGPEFKHKAFEFECISVTSGPIPAGKEIEAKVVFRRKFQSLPRELCFPARTLVTILAFQTPAGIVSLKLHEIWPSEIWCS